MYRVGALQQRAECRFYWRSRADPRRQIVAAVLGIIVTMRHEDAPRRRAARASAAARSDAPVGIIGCYGIIRPSEAQVEHERREIHRDPISAPPTTSGRCSRGGARSEPAPHSRKTRRRSDASMRRHVERVRRVGTDRRLPDRGHAGASRWHIDRHITWHIEPVIRLAPKIETLNPVVQVTVGQPSGKNRAISDSCICCHTQLP
jgi:hypothetical protein